MKTAEVNRTGTINIKSHILLAYADDVDIVGRTERDLTGEFSKIELKEMGLIVNEEKYKDDTGDCKWLEVA